MGEVNLTRRQQQIYEYLQEHLPEMPHPPTLDELCYALGLKSRGSLHKQIQALIDAGLVEPMNNLRRGIRLVDAEAAVLPGAHVLDDFRFDLALTQVQREDGFLLGRLQSLDIQFRQLQELALGCKRAAGQ